MPATYKITVHSNDDITDNELLNVYGYHDQLAIPVPMGDLVDEFVSQIVPQIATVMVGGSSIRRVECEQVIGGTAYIDRPLAVPEPGIRAGEKMPKFVSWGFTYQRANIGERSGAKRIGPISETDVSDGLASVGALVVLNALAVRLNDPIAVALVDIWFPVILERPIPPATVWGFHDMSGVNYVRVTTQNSRKR